MKRRPLNYRFLFRTLALITLCFVSELALQTSAYAQVDSQEQGSENDASQFEASWKVIEEVSSSLLANHFNPPTRQQMMLSACRGLYTGLSQNPPSDLSQKFSQLVSPEQFRAELKQHWDQLLVNAGKPSPTMETAAVRALLADCEPGLTFLDEKAHRVQKQLSENQYVGIGIQLRLTEDGYPEITKPFYGGAAQQAGATSGDLIVSVDGVPTKGRDFGQVIQDLRGAESTEVVVELRHKTKSDEVRKLTMVRNVVPIDSIVGRSQDFNTGKWNIAIEGSSKVAHLRFNSIVGSTAAEMQKMARQIEKEGFQGVVLDFRGSANRAPIELHHAVMLADVLVGSGDLGRLITRNHTKSMTAQSDSVLNGHKIICMCDSVVSGPEFLVISALVNSNKAILLGGLVSSNGLCKKSLVLNSGALEGMSYGIAIPQKGQSESTRTSLAMTSHQGIYAAKLTLPPNHKVDLAVTENVTKALRELFNL